MLASKNVLPECQATSEMFALQSLVSSYIDTLRSIHKCMAGLNDEIVSHKKHIARLKEELTAACSRQLSAPVQVCILLCGHFHMEILPTTECIHNSIQIYLSH